MGITIADVQDKMEKASRYSKTFGHMIWWTFAEQTMLRQDFLNMLTECGIDHAVAPATRKKSALIRALEELTADSKELFRRKVTDDADLAMFVIVRGQVQDGATREDRDYQVKTESRVFFNKATYTIRVLKAEPFSEEEKAQIAAGVEIKERLVKDEDLQVVIENLVSKYMNSYTGDQIRSSVLTYLYDFCQGIKVKENGGLYFAPITKEEEYKKLKKLAKLVAARAGSAVHTMNVADFEDDDSKAMVWQAFVGETMENLSEIEKDLEHLKVSTSRALENRLQAFSKVRTKVEMYNVLLTGTADDLLKRLSRAETLVQDRLSTVKISES